MRKPSKQGVNAVALIIGICAYLAYIPSLIVHYGIDNGTKAFSAPVPFHEVYSVFCALWIGGHAFATVLVWAIYGLLFERGD